MFSDIRDDPESIRKLSKLGRVCIKRNAGTVFTKDVFELMYSYKVVVKAPPYVLKKLEKNKKTMEEAVAAAMESVVAIIIPKYTRKSLDSEEVVADIHFAGIDLAEQLLRMRVGSRAVKVVAFALRLKDRGKPPYNI